MGRFDSYSGLLTAFPYAFRQSTSRLFRSYVVVSAALGVVFAFLMTGALLVLIGNTAGARGGSLTLSRTFYVVVGLLLFLPLVAPVLFVARRHRRDRRVAAEYDTALAAAGYLFAFSVYLGGVASMPARFETNGEVVTRPPPEGLFAPVVELLYAIPPAASPLVPLVGALVVYAAHRRYGSKHGNGEPAYSG
ncbi:hypothetical protein [Halobacterium bonnevillei]|uniref:DUF8056 domain-containing protein n=1 Tax=Halobacterium bonnevillei TaxID=2692200 RepID=A0A6B0SNV5_9EURY|nr:hypothetical protein [Halobacterium bonnevillei]MXR22166.1 hypothetical protein [Halobacterium bonnevillei]